MGYTTAESTITFPGSDGQPVTGTGRGVAVWRRDPSGAWKCVYDAWNHGPEIGACQFLQAERASLRPSAYLRRPARRRGNQCPATKIQRAPGRAKGCE